LLVNDASPDRSWRICQRYAAKDRRVRLLDSGTHQGVNKVRVDGINAAMGELVMLVDSDDYLPRTAVERLWQTMAETDADVVQGRMWHVFDNHGWWKKESANGREALEVTQPELFDKYFITFFGGNDAIYVALWAKLYKKSLFEVSGVATAPPAFRRGQDLMASMMLFPYIQKLVTIGDPVYYYRSGGATSCYSPYYYTDMKEQYALKKEIIKKYNYSKASESNRIVMCRYLYKHVISMYRESSLQEKDIRKFIQEEFRSGFIREITEGLAYEAPFFAYLQADDSTGFLDYCKKIATMNRWRRRINRWLMAMLQLM
jgi:glycosyltransferase involved in cell wall biosynthesis